MLTSNQKDNKVFYTSQIKSNDAISISQVIYPYGMYAVAPKGSQGVTFNLSGQSENQVTLPYDAFTRFSGLQPTEVMIGNQVQKSFIKFKDKGDISIANKSGDLTVDILKGSKTETLGEDCKISIGGKYSVVAKEALDIKSSSNTVSIEAAVSITLTVGSATLTLTPAGIVSSVPITAPGIAIAGAGGLSMGGGDISGNTNMTTAAGKSFNSHAHTSGSYAVSHDGVRPVTGDSGAPS